MLAAPYVHGARALDTGRLPMADIHVFTIATVPTSLRLPWSLTQRKKHLVLRNDGGVVPSVVLVLATLNLVAVGWVFRGYSEQYSGFQLNSRPSRLFGFPCEGNDGWRPGYPAYSP